MAPSCPVRPGSVTSLLAAIFLVCGAVMAALVSFNVFGEPIPNVRNFNSTTDPDYLREKWDWRTSVFTPTLLTDAFAMLGLLFLIFTAQQLRKIYRGHNGVGHRVMFYCFAIGGFLPVVEFLQNLGATSMADWMASPDSSWKIRGDPARMQALDVSFTVTVSRSLWVFSIVNLLLAAGLSLEYFLESENKRGNGLRAHSIFALGIACVAFLTWVMEIAAFWSPFEVFFTAGVLNLVLVGSLCAWCAWLAFGIFPRFDLGAESQPMEYI